MHPVTERQLESQLHNSESHQAFLRVLSEYFRSIGWHDAANQVDYVQCDEIEE